MKYGFWRITSTYIVSSLFFFRCSCMSVRIFSPCSAAYKANMWDGELDVFCFLLTRRAILSEKFCSLFFAFSLIFFNWKTISVAPSFFFFFPDTDSLRSRARSSLFCTYANLFFSLFWAFFERPSIALFRSDVGWETALDLFSGSSPRSIDIRKRCSDGAVCQERTPHFFPRFFPAHSRELQNFSNFSSPPTTSLWIYIFYYG